MPTITRSDGSTVTQAAKAVPAASLALGRVLRLTGGRSSFPFLELGHRTTTDLDTRRNRLGWPIPPTRNTAP